MTMPDSLAARRDEDAAPAGLSAGDWEQVRQSLRGIRYGEVRVIIQDGVVVQIERLEKRRLR
jgi:hypothetical protein